MTRQLMKSLLPVALMMFLLAGCGQLLFSYREASVRLADQIPITGGRNQAGAFVTRDLTVDFTYSRIEQRMILAGSIRFDDSVRRNFTSLRNFHLSALLLDSQGHVLADRGLESRTFGYPDRVSTFETTFELPKGTTFMAFNYSGEARQHGGNGAAQVRFWHAPVVR